YVSLVYLQLRTGQVLPVSTAGCSVPVTVRSARIIRRLVMTVTTVAGYPGQAAPVSTTGSSVSVTVRSVSLVTIVTTVTGSPNVTKMDVINKCFSRKAIDEILSSLEMESMSKVDHWISATIQTLKKASPTSLKIFLRLIREGRLLGIGPCLVCEYRIVCHILKGHYSKDFFEGCRAILIDKDRNPKWEPSKLELVSDSDVDRYFSKLDDEEWGDLELPKRFNNLPAHAISKL
ncbi:3-hydroxyisobutyryl-CoA hydrolase 1, partial [Mucuna pruriens]